MLRVTGMRADGYHQIQTCFKLLPWGDQMRFEFSDHYEACNQVGLSPLSGVKKENNLIYRAAQLLLPRATISSDVYIHLEKTIPMGGGLGGGSSNAATTLKILNEYWQCGFSDEELMTMGLRLGADVPVFIRAQDAIATGVGEQLSYTTFPLKSVLLIFPQVGISTAKIFQDPNLNRKQKTVSLQKAHDPEYWINDCLPIVLKHYPEVRTVYEAFNLHFRLWMSGTGSTLFSVFDDPSVGENAKEMIQALAPCHLIHFK